MKYSDKQSVTPSISIANGLQGANSEQWTQDSPKIKGLSETNDFMGNVVATGDFNGDGYDDVAIGIKGEDVKNNSVKDAGAVQVLYGSKSSTTTKDTLYDQSWTSLRDRTKTADLAIGVPYEDLNSRNVDNKGAVNVLYGSSRGVTNIKDKMLTRRSEAKSDDRFGYALAAGDFGKDGIDDLAVGSPRGDDPYNIGHIKSGVITVFDGTRRGVEHTGQTWSQDTPGVKGSSEKFDSFGNSLSTGDINGDGYMDLSAGIPDEDADNKKLLIVVRLM